MGARPEHVRPVDGVDYDQVDTERLERTPQPTAREVLGERRHIGDAAAADDT